MDLEAIIELVTGALWIVACSICLVDIAARPASYRHGTRAAMEFDRASMASRYDETAPALRWRAGAMGGRHRHKGG